MKKLCFILFVKMIIFNSTINAQLIDSVATDLNGLISDFVQSGVTISNVQFTGDTSSLGLFTNGNTTNLGLDKGIILTTGSLNMPPSLGSNPSLLSSYATNNPGDSLLGMLIPGYTTHDAVILAFDIIPAGNVLKFEFVFASEEYPEYVNSPFNDVFGFFISGPNPAGGLYVNENIALIPGTSIPVSIDNVNPYVNSSYYIPNFFPGYGMQPIVFDGFTTVITVTASVIPLTSYHLRIGITDVGDNVFDSGVFLQCPSLRSYVTTTNHTENRAVNILIPNPLTDNTRCDLYLETSGRMNIQITDFSGRIVHRNELNCMAGHNSIELGHILKDSPSGIYVLSIQTPEGYSSYKLMK